MASRRLRVGVIVPSSNTAMEPMIMAMFSTINRQVQSVHVTVHCSRLRVTKIGLDADAQSQFDLPALVEAASLLADAKVDAIGWGGTSAGWLGLHTDDHFCMEIQNRFGIPATTSTLALIDLVHALGNPPLGLVTPYVPQMNSAIRKVFASANVVVVDNDQSLGITDNHEIGATNQQQLDEMVNKLLEAQQDLKAVTTFCTNLTAAQLAVPWERQYEARDVTVLDSISTVVWGLLAKLTVKPGNHMSLEWGRIFNVPPR